MHNGVITSLSLYAIKYLNEFFVPYGSSLDTNILLTSISSVLLFCFCKSHFFDFFVSKIYVLSAHCNTYKKKKQNFL